MIYKLAAITWTLLILILSVMPTPQADIDVDQGDKAVHFLMYAASTVVFYPAIRRIGLAAILSICLGFAMEVVQYFLPWRSFSIGDAVANSAGAFAVYLWVRSGLPVPRLLRPP